VKSGIKTVAFTAGGIATTAGIGMTAAVNYKRFRRRIAENALVLNETLPINSKWWRDLAKRKGELLYVSIGDSAAQGIGASTPARGYVGLLAQHVRRTTGRTVRVINLSVSGATVGLAVRDQLPRFAKLKPDVVTVAIGANDIARWDAAEFESGIRRLFATLPLFAIVADLPCFHFPQNERKVAEANRILREVAAEHQLTVVPLHATTKRQGFRSVATQFANDLFHPNDRGYRIWADAFLPELTADVSRRFPPLDAAAESAQPDAAAKIPQAVATPAGSVGGAS
jgi:lysophospholipase L1-like esterase